MINNCGKMTDQLRSNVRIVRCPGCRGLLTELANVPVYQCGGCNTILRAKKRKNETKGTGSHIPETEKAQQNELEHVSDVKEAQGSSPEKTFPSTGEQSLGKNCGSVQNEIQDNDREEQSGGMKFTSKLSTPLTCHGNEESSPAAREETEFDKDQCSFEQSNGGDQNAYRYFSGKQSGGVSFSGEVTSSTELNHDESEASWPVAGAHSEVVSEQNNGRNQNEHGYCNKKQPGGISFSEEVASSTELNHDESEASSPVAGAHSEVVSEQNNGRNQNEHGYCNEKQPGGVSFSEEVTSSTELNHDESEAASPVAGAHREVLEQNNGRNQNEHRHCNEKQPGGVSFSEEVTSSIELNHHDESEESLPVAGAHSEVDLEQNDGRNKNEYGYCNGKQPGRVSFSEEDTSSTELNHDESEESLPVAGAHREVDSEQNNGRNQNEYGYCNGKQHGGVNFSEEVTSSTELNHHVAGAHSEVDLEQNNGRNQNESGYCNGKQPGGVSFSEEVTSSIVLNHHKSEVSSPVAGAHSEVDFEQNNRRNHQNEHRCCNGKQPGVVKFYDEVPSPTALYHKESEESSSPLAEVHNEVNENRNCLAQNNGRVHNEFGDYEREWSGNIKFSNAVPSSTELSCQEIEESSPEFGTNTELDENFKSRFIFGSLSVENLLAVSPGDSVITAQGPLGESILTDNHMPEQLEESQKRAVNCFDRMNSVDTLEDIALPKPISEFSVTLREMPKSPTTRSYYAYDGSVSSYDGSDDQVPDLHHLSKRKFKEAKSANTKEMPQRDNYSEMLHQAWNCSSISSEKKHYAMDEFQESTRQDHQVRSRMKFETDESRSRVPFYSRGCHVGYEKGSPSNYDRNEFHCSTSSHLPSKTEYLEEEKIKLLKMVYELQGQLSRTHILQGRANEKQLPSYCDCVPPEVQTCHSSSNTRYTSRIWPPHPSRISRIPFSAGATINRPQVNRSCLHCCPQDWQCSAPLPPHICCNKSQYTAHPRQRYHNLYCSTPSSPQHYMGSEFSDDHWQKNRHEVKKYSRERLHLAKRYVRPVASGAPFLICHSCLKLLQLPEDFLLFKRRCHKLRCSACSVILKFSLQNKTHIVRYIDLDFARDAIAPPPSEVDDCSIANNWKKLASVLSTNNCPPCDPVSCSDDYGPPLHKSYSTEGESLYVHALERDSNGRKMSSSSSFDPMEERKKQGFFKEYRNKYKNSVKTLASSVGSSFKISKAEKSSSEIEESSPRGRAGLALHRLMGYSSPSEVIGS
ncbi:unnamed protein product [Camellia sinensis]